MIVKLEVFARILRPSARVEEAAKCNDEALAALKKEIVPAAPAAKDWPECRIEDVVTAFRSADRA